MNVDYNKLDSLAETLDAQPNIVEFMKLSPDRNFLPKLSIIDDFAQNSAFTRQSHTLHTLYIRGRRNMTSYYGSSANPSSQPDNQRSCNSVFSPN